MKKLIITSVLFLSPVIAIAHADHAPRVAVCGAKDCLHDEIKAAVPKTIELLVAKGKIEASWASAKLEKLEQKQFKKGPEWVAILFDEKQPDQKKQRLYIFITTKGYLNGSNFTGE